MPEIKNYQNIKVTKLPNSEVEIEGEISVEKLKIAWEKALKNLGEKANIPGFRKGHIPENILIKQLGEVNILEEAAEIALQEEYPNVIAENDIKAIGRPAVTITKLAPENPLGFKIKTAVMPEIKLADYKKISKEHGEKKPDKIEVTDKEVEDVIAEVRKSRAIKHEHPPISTDKGEGEEENASHNKQEDTLPDLTDEFVKSLGEFKDVADFKQKIKENITREKEHAQKEKARLALVENLVKNSDISLPEILVEGELEKMMAQFKDDIEKMGLKYTDYLTHIKKTEEDLRKEWRENAEKKAKLQLILNKISVEENIKPEEEEVKKEMDHILEHHKDADRFRVRMYVETFLTNNKVFEFLESK
ncbi:MAG: hypothetical protein HQ402_01250 [Parcubacteria group bacterium]|nr:hypothetical protein [Parcubacteria group bacterium]